MQENYDDLKNIVGAVVIGDGVSARELAQGHVGRFNAYMEKKSSS